MLLLLMLNFSFIVCKMRRFIALMLTILTHTLSLSLFLSFCFFFTEFVLSLSHTHTHTRRQQSHIIISQLKAICWSLIVQWAHIGKPTIYCIWWQYKQFRPKYSTIFRFILNGTNLRMQWNGAFRNIHKLTKHSHYIQKLLQSISIR